METKITNCIAAEKAVRDVMYGLDHEEVWGLFLNTDNTVISREMLSKGTLTQTSIDNRTVIKRALMNNANAVIILHNHLIVTVHVCLIDHFHILPWDNDRSGLNRIIHIDYQKPYQDTYQNGHDLQRNTGEG